MQSILVSPELAQMRRCMSLRAGEFFVFDELLLHRTSPTAMDQGAPKRVGVGLRFVKATCPVSPKAFP